MHNSYALVEWRPRGDSGILITTIKLANAGHTMAKEAQMSYLLGRGSAVEWLRQNRNMRIVLPEARWSVPYPLLEGSRTRLKEYLPMLSGLTLPIQLVV